jgi:hypothetical protein
MRKTGMADMRVGTISSMSLGTALTFAAATFAFAQDKIVKIGALSDRSARGQHLRVAEEVVAMSVG